MVLPILLGAGKAALPLLGGTALAGGIIGGVGRIANENIPGLASITGMDKDSIAAGERYDLDNPESYKDDPGDYARSLVSGVSVNDIKDKAKKNAIDKINRSLLPIVDRLKSGYKNLGLPGPDPTDFTYKEGESTKAPEFRAQDAIATLRAAEKAKARGVPIQDLIGINSAAGMNAAVEKHLDDKGKTKEGEVRTQQLSDLRDSRAYQAGIRAEQLGLQMAQLQAQQQQAAAQNNLQLQQMINQNNRLDRQDERNTRKDQQALIMMLVQGLGNLSF